MPDSPNWQRKVELAVGPEGEEGRAWGDELRISWKVEHSLSSSANTAEIDIYNLSKDSIDYIRNGKKVARLRVGHRSLVQIFVGYIQNDGITIERDGGDRKITMEATDKAFEGHKKHIDRPLTQPTTEQALRDVAEDVGISIGKIDINLDDESMLKIPRVISGTAMEFFDKVGDLYDLNIWTEDGKLYALEPERPKGPEKVRKFSAENGTLFEVQPKKKGRIKVRTLLEPRIRPADLFLLEHDRYDGAWMTRDVEFQGDSGWNTEFESRIIAQPR